MSSPVTNNTENVPDKNSGPASPATDKSASFTSTKLKRGGTVERPSSETHSNPDLIKTKDNSRPKSCGEELLVQKPPSLGVPKSRESTPQNLGNAWFVTVDDRNRRSRSASKTSAKESDTDKKHGKNAAGSKNSSSGIPLPKRQNTLSKVSSKSSTRPPSKSKLQRSPSSELKNNSPNRRSLELQFSLKKKRLECLKKELVEKQKPVLEIYQQLTQLKKKLDESGKAVRLEEMKFIDCNEVLPRARTPLSGNRQGEESPAEFDIELLKAMKEIVNVIPKPLNDLCRSLMTKRGLLVDMMEKYCNNDVDTSELHKKIYFLKTESTQLEQKIENACTEQSKQIEELITKWQQMLERHEVVIQPPPVAAGPPPERFHELYKKFKKQDHEIKEYKQKVEDLQNALNDRPEKADLHKAEENIRHLNSQIKELDAQLTIERKNSALGSEAEKQVKILRSKVKELDNKKHEAENKIVNLQKALKQKEENMKAAEKAWEAEKQELIKTNNQDKQLLNKLTKDRGFLETRVKTLAEIVEENEKTVKETEERCKEEVRRAKQEVEEERIARETMEKKYEYMRQEFFKMEVTNQQAIDLVVTRKEGNGEGPITTEREAELYTELLATRVALKAAEDKVKNYAREKLRFIDTIERLSSNSENNVESLAASLVHKEEEITLIEKKMEQYEELVRKQKLEIANLNASIVNMEQRLALNDEHYPTKDMKDSDLNYVLRENKLKLDEMLRKSLDYEQKIIKYDHDFEMQQKQIYEMDNLLKVRDGLIGMLKAKKDELFVENESLTKYANEIRDALMETKEELAVKQEEIQQLYAQLEQKSKMLIRQDKKIKDLKDTLSSTNEKRYKLQDTLGAMEKELQSTKAHVNRMSSEIQARYEIGTKTKISRTQQQNSNIIISNKNSDDNIIGNKNVSAVHGQPPHLSTVLYNNVNIMKTCDNNNNNNNNNSPEIIVKNTNYVPSKNARYCSKVLQYKYGKNPFLTRCSSTTSTRNNESKKYPVKLKVFGPKRKIDSNNCSFSEFATSMTTPSLDKTSAMAFPSMSTDPNDFNNGQTSRFEIGTTVSHQTLEDFHSTCSKDFSVSKAQNMNHKEKCCTNDSVVTQRGSSISILSSTVDQQQQNRPLFLKSYRLSESNEPPRLSNDQESSSIQASQNLFRRRSLPNTFKQDNNNSPTRKKKSRSSSPTKEQEIIECKQSKSASRIEETIFRLNEPILATNNDDTQLLKQNSIEDIEEDVLRQMIIRTIEMIEEQQEGEDDDKYDENLRKIDEVDEEPLPILDSVIADTNSNNLEQRQQQNQEVPLLLNKAYLHRVTSSHNNNSNNRPPSTSNSRSGSIRTRSSSADTITAKLRNNRKNATRPSSVGSNDSRYTTSIAREDKNTQTDLIDPVIVVTRQDFLQHSHKLSQSLQSMVASNFKGFGVNNDNDNDNTELDNIDRQLGPPSVSYLRIPFDNDVSISEGKSKKNKSIFNIKR